VARDGDVGNSPHYTVCKPFMQRKLTSWHWNLLLRANLGLVFVIVLVSLVLLFYCSCLTFKVLKTVFLNVFGGCFERNE
jgi:hypothetical protein